MNGLFNRDICPDLIPGCDTDNKLPIDWTKTRAWGDGDIMADSF
jgi:hypothetical protein